MIDLTATIGLISRDEIDFVYLDLDGVTADFEVGMQQEGMGPKDFKMWPGSYLRLPFYPGARLAIHKLMVCMGGRVNFLTKPPSGSPYAWSEKAMWVRDNLGEDAVSRLIITHDKSHVGTEKSVLFDDRPHKGGVERFRGTLIHFGLETEALPGKDNHWAVALNTLALHVLDLRTSP